MSRNFYNNYFKQLPFLSFQLFNPFYKLKKKKNEYYNLHYKNTISTNIVKQKI